MLLGSIITLALITGFIYYIRRKADRRNPHGYHRTPTHTAVVNHNPFHCVEIHHQAECCAAIKEVQGKRFLSNEAPSLPIECCDHPHCDCDYIHHEDRRVHIRRVDIGLQHDMHGQGKEEREKREIKRLGRRETD